MSQIYSNGDIISPPTLKTNTEYTGSFQTDLSAIPPSNVFEYATINPIDYFFSDYNFSSSCPDGMVAIVQLEEEYGSSQNYPSVFANPQAITLPTGIGESISGQLTEVEFADGSSEPGSIH